LYLFNNCIFSVILLLVWAMIVLIKCHKKRTHYDITGKIFSDTIKPLAMKSFDGDTKNEIMFPNPTYQDLDDTHDNEFSVQLAN